MILETAAAKNLSAVSFTEHENIDSFARAREKARELGIEYINGIEVSGSIMLDGNWIPMDVLGYFYNDDAPHILSMLAEVRSQSQRRTEAFMLGLQMMGIKLQPEDIEGESVNGLSAFSIRNALANQGHTDPWAVQREAILAAASKHPGFSGLESNRRPPSTPGTDLDVATIIRNFKADNALTFMAHPFWLTHLRTNSSSPQEVWRHIHAALDAGIDGIEVYHGHNTGFIEELLGFCQQNRLPASGGSDSHGAGSVGAVDVPCEVLNSMRRVHAGRHPWIDSE